MSAAAERSALPLERMILNAMASSVLALDGEFAGACSSTRPPSSCSAPAGACSRTGRSPTWCPFDSSLFDLIRRVQLAGNSVSDYGVELPLNRSVTPPGRPARLAARRARRATAWWSCTPARSRTASTTS